MRLRIVTLAAVFAVAAASAPLAQSTTAPTPMPSLDPRGQQTPPPSGQRGQTPPAVSQNAQEQMPRGARVDRNVKLDLTIVDTYSGKPVPKTVSLMLASGYGGRIRTQNVFNNRFTVELNVDAMAEVVANGPRVRVHVTFEYNPAPEQPTESGPIPRPSSLNESFVVLLDDGKPLLVTRSADPATDRSVTVELTATIQRQP